MAAKKTTAKKTAAKKTAKKCPVLVTTEFRGVFFGYTTAKSADPMLLTGVRNCLYWSTDVGGFLGLAEKGPGAKCRIAETLTGTVRLVKVTCVADVSTAAEQAWLAAAVYRG